jgi:sigma-B regulation protein RsbU (phosphoserine phosphatase)
MPSCWLRRVVLCAVVCAMLCSARLSGAQDGTAGVANEPAVFDLAHQREPMMVLDGLWRFRTGDDEDGRLGWARPGFDDSGWALIGGDKSWSQQGYRDYGGVGWYRAKVKVPEDGKRLAIYVPYAGTNYELYMDGRPVGVYGGLPPEPTTLYSSEPRVYTLPRMQGGVMTLALRMWHPPHWAKAYGGGLLGGVKLGDAGLIEQRLELDEHNKAWGQVDGIFLAIFETLAALAALGLFALRPAEREYLWFGVWLLLSALIRCLFIYTAFHAIGRMEHDLLWQAIYRAATLAEMAFYYRLLKGHRGVLFWLAIASIPASIVVMVLGLMGLISVALWIELGIGLTLPLVVWTVELLLRRAKEGLPDARLLCVPVLLQEAVAFTVRMLNLTQRGAGLHLPVEWFTWVYQTSTWPFPFSLQDVADAAFLVGMLAILIRRFGRTSRHEDELEREREAARSVQQLLISESIANYSGLVVHSVYRPAGQVGGDFFQILPVEQGAAAGSVLVVIGDVSGKGLPAAMTVSLVVGTLSTLAQYVADPGELLMALNKAILRRSLGGFTTCLILRANAGGELVMASAGHLAPYLDGGEIAMENGFPLGLVAGAHYDETRMMMRPGQQLTLVTDGVVEARGKTGELLGFERTAGLSRLSAGAIAQEAQSFGQDDDITVLTLVRP